MSWGDGIVVTIKGGPWETIAVRDTVAGVLLDDPDLEPAELTVRVAASMVAEHMDVAALADDTGADSTSERVAAEVWQIPPGLAREVLEAVAGVLLDTCPQLARPECAMCCTTIDVRGYVDAPYTDGFTVEPFTGDMCDGCAAEAGMNE